MACCQGAPGDVNSYLLDPWQVPFSPLKSRNRDTKNWSLGSPPKVPLNTGLPLRMLFNYLLNVASQVNVTCKSGTSAIGADDICLDAQHTVRVSSSSACVCEYALSKHFLNSPAKICRACRVYALTHLASQLQKLYFSNHLDVRAVCAEAQ